MCGINNTFSSMDVEPREAIHVEELLKEDVEEAKTLGMYVIWKSNNRELLEDLKAKPDYVIRTLSELLE